MGLFGGAKKADEPEESQGRSLPPATIGASRVPGAPVGIDHAIMLMRSLPTDKNVDLVVRVLKTTLESLNIRVSDIVTDGAQRLQKIESRVAQLKGEISGLEQEIATRKEEISRLDAAHAETSQVKDYLEGEEIDVVPVSKQ